MEPFFGTRFGYLCWLWFLRTGELPVWAEIGRSVGRTGPAVSAWMRAKNAPTDYRLHPPLRAYFELPDDDRWLIEGVGVPPEPELWHWWLRFRQSKRLPKDAFRGVAKADVEAEKKRGRRA